MGREKIPPFPSSHRLPLLPFIFCYFPSLYTVNELINAQGVYLILGIQAGAFNR